MLEVAVHGFRDWRDRARELLESGVPPEHISWRTPEDRQPALFDREQYQPLAASAKQTARVPRRFVELAETVSCHRDPGRWALLYRVLYRITHGEPSLLKIEVDDDVRALMLMERAVGRDIHNMEGFLRFRKSGDEYIAWYRPDHRILARAAPFFVRRLGAMRWAILTPDASAFWDGARLHFGPGAPASAAPQGDELEALWRSYYASTFNPARANPKLLQALMPVRHWSAMPESRVIPQLLCDAGGRVAEMAAKQPPSAASYVPRGAGLAALREAAGACRGCDLHCRATQAVFGEGPENARIALVGEQPGDQEDISGRPFVGPAGRLLDQALAEAHIERSEIYVTNAVKHFKFLERGKRRLHQSPNAVEIAACRPWLEAEMTAVRPEVIVCLGASAAQSVMGRVVRVTRERGRFFPHHWAKQAVCTLHPSALLRAPDEVTQQAQYRLLVEDLRAARGA